MVSDARPGPYCSVMKVSAGLTAVLVVDVSIDLGLTVVLPIKVTARLAAVLVVAVNRPGCYSWFKYEGGNWAGSCAGGGCLQA